MLAAGQDFLRAIAPAYGARLVEVRVAELRSDRERGEPPGARLIVVLTDARALAPEIRRLAHAAMIVAQRHGLDAVPDLFVGEEWLREGTAARNCSVPIAA